jgi:membrane protease YdiL (CAAX protease family)
MTLPIGTATAARTAGPPLANRGALLLLASAGTGLLAAKSWIVAAAPGGPGALVALFTLLAFVGAVAVLPSVAADPPARLGLGVATAIGVALFAVGRFAVGGETPMHASMPALALALLAAVAEELWFRRLCYGLLVPAGEWYATSTTAVLFALIHLPVYGAWVLPLDLCAGLLLGWLRARSGSWVPPAISHAFANVLILL